MIGENAEYVVWMVEDAKTDGKFLAQLSDCQLLNKHFAAWS
jgi:hypothetical protein